MIFFSDELEKASLYFEEIFKEMGWTYNIHDKEHIPNAAELHNIMQHLVDEVEKNSDTHIIASGRFEVHRTTKELVVRLEPSSEILWEFEQEIKKYGAICDDEIYKYFIGYEVPAT